MHGSDMSADEQQVVASTRKRVRRNAIRPNSVECTALKEFSILHTLNEKLDISESDKRQRREAADNFVDENGSRSEDRPETEDEAILPIIVPKACAVATIINLVEESGSPNQQDE